MFIKRDVSNDAFGLSPVACALVAEFVNVATPRDLVPMPGVVVMLGGTHRYHLSCSSAKVSRGYLIRPYVLRFRAVGMPRKMVSLMRRSIFSYVLGRRAVPSGGQHGTQDRDPVFPPRPRRCPQRSWARPLGQIRHRSDRWSFNGVAP